MMYLDTSEALSPEVEFHSTVMISLEKKLASFTMISMSCA